MMGGTMIGHMLSGRANPRYLSNNSTRYAPNRQKCPRRMQTDVPSSPATRPEDLCVRPAWYSDDQLENVDSPTTSDRANYPYSARSNERPNFSLFSASRERESSIESADLTSLRGTSAPTRKAYMDLTDAMALLDETCPNQDASPSLTPKTPRTPLTPFPTRIRRPRSKSSDNSSNYSNQESQNCELNQELTKSQDKQPTTKDRRPFLRKIGISKTEDRPFLAKITPRIIGKPYLEKIGPSRAVEKPFLEKIGSSRTLDRFTFDALRELPRAMVKRCQPVGPSPLTIERAVDDDELGDDEDDDDVVLCVVKDNIENNEVDNVEENNEDDSAKNEESKASRASINRGRRNGKAYLLKMYSFETEDLNERNEAISSSVATIIETQGDPIRGTCSLDDALDSGPSSFPPSEDSQERASSSRSDVRSNISVAELLKCRVTTSDEIFTTGRVSSPRESTSWGNSPRWPKRRSRRLKASATAKTRIERDDIKMGAFPSDESTPNSPIKRRHEEDDRLVVQRRKNASLPREMVASPAKTRRQVSEERPSNFTSQRNDDENPKSDEKNEGRVNFARCKSRRQTFKDNVEKLGGTNTRRQVSEEVLDRNRENGECPGFDDHHQSRFERRGISSDNLKLSRETVVASVPSTSSLGYQSGDSSLVSQRSSHNSQDFVRGTLRLLHDKFELDDVPSESYAAFKRRTRANYCYNANQRNSGIEEKSRMTLNALENSSNTKNEDVDTRNIAARSMSEELADSRNLTKSKSVLRKQEGIDQQSDHENDNDSSIRGPKRRIYNEPSQETMDLLTELRRVKSLLKTPSYEDKDKSDDYAKHLTRFPKKILLTDREFCLSVERENSVRRRPSILPDENQKNGCEESWRRIQGDTKEDNVKQDPLNSGANSDVDDAEKIKTGSFRRIPGPALFEKRCLSLDYADDDKPAKPEARAISLVASRNPRSEDEPMDSSDPAGLAYDTRSYCSDVFTSPSEENEEIQHHRSGDLEAPSFEKFNDVTETIGNINNNCTELDIAIPVDHVIGTTSSKRRIHVQGRTSDFYEIISPRSTPFRVKKRLGRISVEETVKQESFTIGKVDCRSVATQKRTKCFPL